MHGALQLYESRVREIVMEAGKVIVVLSHAYIHKSAGDPGKDPGTGWSQEAQFVFEGCSLPNSLPPLPNTIAEGAVEVGGVIYDDVIPLPFDRRARVTLRLTFMDSSSLQVTGVRCRIELLSKPIYLESLK
jgi:hypothetical protein